MIATLNNLIESLIKTDCGRSKYSELASRTGFVAKLRLIWFIFFATIKDWKLDSKD